MKLQKASLCALYSILELARYPQKQISATEIAAKYGVSANHLTKVMRVLARSGHIESMRGVRGGYRFCGNVKRLTLFDIIQLFEDVCEENNRQGSAAAATDVGMALGGIMREIDGITCATLKSITLATMLKTIERLDRDRAKPV